MAQVMGISVASVGYPAERTPKKLLVNHITSASTGALMVKSMRLGPKITETVKGKLSLGAKILKAGGIEKLFKYHFSVGEEEKLLKVSQSYLSTTAGLLFISTDKVAFCSERSIITSSPTGELKICHKVLNPISKILKANKSQHMKRPSRKYIYVVTGGNFDFWFMGPPEFLKNLQISSSGTL